MNASVHKAKDSLIMVNYSPISISCTTSDYLDELQKLIWSMRPLEKLRITLGTLVVWLVLNMLVWVATLTVSRLFLEV